MNLFDALRESHRIQRSLCAKLLRSKGDDARRQSLFLQLKVELEAHAAAEERFLYVPLLMSDSGLGASRHALSEHHEIEELCEDLSVRHKTGVGWMSMARKLSDKVHHHLKEEESKFFKVGGRILSDRKKATLLRQYRKEVVRMRRKYAGEYQAVSVAASGKVRPSRKNK
jgi:hypothetical protein